MQINKLATYLWKLWGVFIGAQESLHPILYFLVLGWIQMSGEEMPAGLVLTFGFMSIWAHKSNPLFMFSPWTMEHPLTSIYLIPCLLSCTSREKLAIFSLAFTRSCFTDQIPRTALLFLWSLVISRLILKQLCFSSRRDNQLFFYGFCISSAIAAIKFSKIILSRNIHLFIQLLLLAAILSVSVDLMKRRLIKLGGSQPQELQYQGQMRIYMEGISEMLRNSILSQAVMVEHKKVCDRIDCFCRRKNDKRNNAALLKQLFSYFLKRLEGKGEGYIRERYISYHLKENQIINAVWQLKQSNSKSYFERASVIRMNWKITEWNLHTNSSNVFGREFEYGLKFDGILMQLAKRAVEVVKLKKKFWRELGRESPRVGILQKTGNDTVKMMYELNEFYARQVRIKEQKLSLLDGTALYAVYLLSTTNFRDYAESLIKASAKTMEQSRLFDCAQSETYAVSAEVHASALTLLQNPKPLTMNQQNVQNKKELIIRSISLGLCRTLGFVKDQVLGKQLNTIIPMGYKEVHNVRLGSLLNFSLKQEVTPSKILHRELTLPMKGAGNRIIVCKVLIKINPSSKSELSFISVVKLLNTRTKTALLDSKGIVTQIQDGFDESLLQHSQVQRYYQRAISTWLHQGFIQQQRFNIIVNASNYAVCMSSPLLILFIEKGKLVQTVPPVHVQITNQVANRRLRAERDGGIANQFNKMEAVLNIEAQSSAASSTNSTSAVNILSAFSQTYSTVYYRLLQGIFLLIMVICTGCTIGAHYSSGLQWISSWQGNNPINDTMNLHALHMHTIKLLLVKGNFDTFYNESSVNKTVLSSYFPYGDYRNYSMETTLNLENAFKNGIYNCLKSRSILKQSINTKLSKILNIPNPVPITILDAATVTYQQFSYLEILMFYALDANLIAKRKDSIISYGYTIEISDWQNATGFQGEIDEKIAKSANLSLTLHLVFIVVIIMLMVPLFCLLRKRSEEHIVVFDILASVQSSMTSKQVDSLRYVENILINFKEADEILKNNVMDYQANALIPKRQQQQRRASAENQLVIGLEEYDRANEQSKYQSLDSRVSSKEKNAEKASFLSFVRRSFNRTVKQDRTLRRRDGDIDLNDSWMSPSRKIIGSHFLLYILVSLSAIILVLGLVINRHFTFDLQQGSNLLFTLYQQQVEIYDTILTSQVLIGQGVDFTSQFFKISDVLNNNIIPLIERFPQYHYNNDFPVKEVPQCQGVAYQKLCRYRTNQILLKSQLGSMLKDIVQLRYNYDHDNIPFNLSKEDAYKIIKQKDLYIDSIAYKLEEITIEQISIVSDHISHQALTYSSKKDILLLMGVVWIVISMIIGLFVILGQKRRYFREVFLITFLNREMIAKNKRVESFLERLARNNGV